MSSAEQQREFARYANIQRRQQFCANSGNSSCTGMMITDTATQWNVMNAALHLQQLIYGASKTGMAMCVHEYLEELPAGINRSAIINQEFHEDDGRILTPFVAAAYYGRINVVKMMLEKFKPVLEKECTIIFDGHLVYGVTALWCASSMGHCNVVKLLVRNGAVINHFTKNNSTPLRAACFNGRLDIVKYLVAHGADVNLTNKYNNNCLMIASYKGHVDVVEFLLKNGALPSQQANCGASALHYAAEVNNVDVCRLLLDYGAKLLPNEFGFSPVIMAADRVRENVVNMFVERPDLLTNNEKVDALELLGASFANDKDNYSLSRSHQYLMEAMKLRYSNPDSIIYKNNCNPVAAYDDWVESQTIEELQAIRLNHTSLHLEALTIRERILGTHFPDLVHPIIYRGAVNADNGLFDKCENLWLHALKLRQSNNITVQRDLLRFAQLFSQIYHIKSPIKAESIISVLECCMVELERNKAQMDLLADLEVIEEYESNIVTTLYLITILTKILKLNETQLNPTDLRDIIKRIMDMDLRTRDGQTLLHLAVNGHTPVDDFHTNDVCKFPCIDTVKLLLCCDPAMIFQVDHQFNTPLHTLISNEYMHRLGNGVSIVDTIEELLQLCNHFGVHLDAVNKKGQAITDLGRSEDVKCLLHRYESNALKLKCLASKAIVRHNINHRDLSPYFDKYIHYHNPRK